MSATPPDLRPIEERLHDCESLTFRKLEEIVDTAARNAEQALRASGSGSGSPGRGRCSDQVECILIAQARTDPRLARLLGFRRPFDWPRSRDEAVRDEALKWAVQWTAHALGHRLVDDRSYPVAPVFDTAALKEAVVMRPNEPLLLLARICTVD